jgi:hypothetical protein
MNRRHSHSKGLESSGVNEHGYVQWSLLFLLVCRCSDVSSYASPLIALHGCQKGEIGVQDFDTCALDNEPDPRRKSACSCLSKENPVSARSSC